MKFPRTQRGVFRSCQGLSPAVQTVFANCILAPATAFVLCGLLWLPQPQLFIPSSLASQASGLRRLGLCVSQAPGSNQTKHKRKQETRGSVRSNCCEHQAREPFLPCSKHLPHSCLHVCLSVDLYYCCCCCFLFCW